MSFVPFGVAHPATSFAGSVTPMTDLLEDFNQAMDTMEWSLLISAFVFALGMAVCMVSTLIIWVVPGVHSYLWYMAAWTGGILSVLSMVYLVEPRPTHWLPWLHNAWDGCRGGFSEWKLRARRWWRWRRRYETKTKLNV